MKRPLVLVVVLAACSRGLVPSSPEPSTSAAAPASIATASPPQGSDAELGAYLDDYVGAHGKKWGDAYAFRGIVAAARDGQLLAVRSFGKANERTGAAADADTRFRIGSITKQFTAACILQLAERGKLSLGDTITRHLPDYPARTGEAITLHHLLSHTSGLPSYTDDGALMATRGTPHTPAEVLATFAHQPLKFTPGAEWDYSNSNYFLLGLVIEKVSGEPFEAYLLSHVLGPAGMTRTSTVDAPEAPNTAVGYDAGDDERIAVAHAVDMSLPFAAGALRSTVSDLVKWDRALTGTTVLSEASKVRMNTPVLNHYGYGIGVDDVGGHRLLTHGGGIDGFNAVLMRIPDAGVVLIVLANGPVDAQPIMRALRPMVLERKRTPPPVERAVLPLTSSVETRVCGDYAMSAASRKDLAGKLPPKVLAAMARAQITGAGGALFFTPAGQPRDRLFWAGGDVLFTKKDGLELHLQGASQGPAKALVLRQQGLEIRYERSGVP